MQGNRQRLHTAFLMNQKDDEILKETVFRYMDRFDPIHLKYAIEPCRIIDEKIYKSPLPTFVRNKAILYESTFRYGDLNKETYSSIRKNLMLVYGSEYVVKKDIHLFHLTEKKIIRDYLAIPQLEKMFDEDYFNFEWDMHVGVNFTEHRNDYQRDHFIHEIRDLYSMLILLDDYGFYNASFDILRDKTASKISRFAYQKFNNFLMNKSGNYSLLEQIHPKLLESLTRDDNVSNNAKLQCSSVDKYAETYFFKYVIYASSMMAALFHDMGYPICHFLNVRNRISEYNPTLYMFTHNNVESFDQISSLLSSSLLFTIISPAEIKEAMQCHDGKYNHGAYSAIAFLMQFYNSGIIFSLPEEKQCAIEIAAVAIYNHTIKFRTIDKKSKDKFYQPVFQQNPIAFLLRLCDDLQEWGRRYFEFSHQSDIPFCRKCFLPSVFHHDSELGMVSYSCLCSVKDKKRIACNSFRRYQFMNRKLYLVTTSEYMFSDIIKVAGNKKDNTTKKVLRFKINYDYYKLLNITRINPEYAKFRLSELNLLKKLLKNQCFSDYPQMGFDYIYLDYFMSANPLTIKVKILQKYLEMNCINQRMLSTKKSKIYLIENILKNNTFSPTTNDLKKLLANGVLDFYLSLLNEAMITRKEINTFISEKKEENEAKTRKNLEKIEKKKWEGFYTIINTHTKEFCGLSEINSVESDYYKRIMQVLVYETLEQYAKETYVYEKNENLYTESFISSELYYNQYAPKENTVFYNCVAAYCNAENDFNNYKYFDEKRKNKYLNYFADLAFFEAMNRVVQKRNLVDFLG